MAEGTYTIVANLAADEKYESSTSSKVFDVVKKNLTVTLGDVGTINVGSSVTFTATLNETVTGNVVFNINGVNYIVSVDGKTATYTYTPADNTTLRVTAIFIGNDMFNANSSALKEYDVFSVESQISLSDVTIEVGEVAKIVISVTDGATGVVNVTVNGETQSVGLVDSKATVFVTGLSQGDYPITVKYLGDDKYLPSQNTNYNVIVNKISKYDFTVIASDTVVGGSSVVTVFMPGDANGNITILGKTAKIVNGTASIVLDKEITVGNKEITVAYGHDSKYADKSGVVANYNVDKANSTVGITVDNVYVIGNTITITLTTVNGTATVNINNKDYTVANNHVTFTANVTGKYDVVATIAETNNYYGSTASASFDIIKASSGISIVVNPEYTVGEGIEITLVPVNGTAVSVTINGVSYPVNSNKVVIPAGLAEGTYTIIANLTGDANYESSSNYTVFRVVKDDLTITVSDATTPSSIVVGSEVVFTADLSEKVTGDVVFNINGANYTVHVSDASVATCKYTPVNNATLTVVATFTGNDKYNSKTS